MRMLVNLRLMRVQSAVLNPIESIMFIFTRSRSNNVYPFPFQAGILQDLVISANPSSPPLSIAVLYSLLSQQYKVLTACHTHSSVRGGVSDKLRQGLGSNGTGQTRGSAQLAITLIWKDGKFIICELFKTE